MSETIPSTDRRHVIDPDAVSALFESLPTLVEDALHEPYFRMLRDALEKLLLHISAEQTANDYESRSFKELFGKLLFTVEALEMKYSYRHAMNDAMWIDILGSGFPTLMVVAEANADLLNKEKRLASYPSWNMLLELSLNYMMKSGEEPEAILWQMAERNYLEMLDADKLFLPFVQEQIVRDDAGAPGTMFRTYQVMWGSYDYLTNRPYLHLLKFHQDAHEKALEESEWHMKEVCQVLKAEGSKASDVAILARAIDEALEWVHPKFLKRVGLGPLYTRIALEQMDRKDWTAEHAAVHDLLVKYGTAGDFLLFFNEEMVFSKRQLVSSAGLMRGDKVREEFFLPDVDMETYKRHASHFEPHVLLSYDMLQAMLRDPVSDQIALFRRAQKIAYDAQGGVHAFKQ